MKAPGKACTVLCIVLFFSLLHSRAITKVGTGGIGHTTGLIKIYCAFTLTVVASEDQVGVLAARRKVELRRLCAESASPLSRSFFFFLVETTERKLCARCSVTTPGCAGSIVCSTLVKCTQPHQRRIVKKVRGSEIAAKSQTLFETRMCPFESVWTNCVEKKFFGELTWNPLEPCLQILTATIVVGRYTRVITVKILTAAASFVLLS